MSRKDLFGPSMGEYKSLFEERMGLLGKTRPPDLMWPEHGRLPLDLLEQLLTDEENMNRAGYSGPSGKLLPILFDSLQEYCRKTNDDVSVGFAGICA